MVKLPEGNDFVPYRKRARTFRRIQCAELARIVGGGICGPGPSSMVKSAANALAWSEYFGDQAALQTNVMARAELATKAIQFGSQSRQLLLTAHELCAREAQLRPTEGPSPHAALAELFKNGST